MPALKEIHGDKNCHICGKPKAGDGDVFCSYPHGLVPDKRVGDTDVWSWTAPKPDTTNG